VFDKTDKIIDFLAFIALVCICLFLSYCPAPSNAETKNANRQNHGTVSNFVSIPKKMALRFNPKPFNSLILLMVPKKGLEPSHLTALDPKSTKNNISFNNIKQ